MDPTDLLVTQEEPENLVQLDQKVFQDELVAMDLLASEEPQVLQELQDHEDDKEKSEQLAKKVELELSETLAPRELKATEDWMVWLVRWEDLDQLEKPVWVDEKENVEVLDLWELQEDSDYPEDRDHEELWADVECQDGRTWTSWRSRYGWTK